MVEGKRCNKEMEPTIDPATDVVFCDCGKELEDQDAITVFARRQMKVLKQTNVHAKMQAKVKQSNEFLEKIRERQKQASKAANPQRPKFTSDADINQFAAPTEAAVPLADLKTFLNNDVNVISSEQVEQESLDTPLPSEERPSFVIPRSKGSNE